MFRFLCLLVGGGRISNNFKNIQFIEKYKEEKGFSKFYDQEIRPKVLKAEKIRVFQLKKVIFRSRIFAINFTSCSLLLYQLLNMNNLSDKGEGDLISIYFFIITIHILWVQAAITEYKNQIKSDFYSKIFKFLGDFSYESNGISSGSSIFFGNFFYRLKGCSFSSENVSKIEGYNKFGIIPNYDRYSYEDFIYGRHKDVGLEFSEIKLISGHGKHKKIVFKGVVIKFDFNKRVLGKTIVKADLGKVGNLFKKAFDSNLKALQRVELEDNKFEGMFEVYSDDQVESRYLLTTSFMERIKKLSEFFGSKKFEASFCDNSLFLMFYESQDMFEPGSIFKEINLVKDCRKVIKQMNLIFDIIDVLKLDQKIGL